MRNKAKILVRAVVIAGILAAGLFLASCGNDGYGGGGGGIIYPYPFNLLMPENGATTGVTTTPTLTWSASLGATAYTVEIDLTPDFTPPLEHSATGITMTSYTVSGTPLSASTPYYWQVKAYNYYGQVTAANAPFSFTTGP